MKQIPKNIALFLFTAFISIAAVSANACGDAYHTYYLDRNCNLVHTNAWGEMEVVGRYGMGGFEGLTLHKDCCSNRWFYQDQFGNRMYVYKRCA